MAASILGWGVRPRPEELKRLLAEDVHVRVFTRERDAPDAGRTYIELWNTARQPDGKEKTQVFVIDREQFDEVAERVRALDPEPKRREAAKERTEEPRREESRREGEKEAESRPRAEASRELWPVVKVQETLRTGAVVRVEKWFKSRDDAEGYAARWSNLAALTVPVSKEAARDGRLVVSEREASPKLGKLIRNAREHERYHERKRQEVRESKAREERQRWSDRRTFGPEARSHSLGELVRSKSVGRTRADLFRRTDEKGRTHETVLVTQPVRQADGSLRLVTTEHTPQELRAAYREWQALRRERAEERSEFLARNGEKPEAGRSTDGNPKPEPARPLEAKSARTTQYAAYMERLGQEERRHNQLGVWYGVGKPKKNQLVRFVSGTEFDPKTGAIVERPGRVYPVRGPVLSEAPKEPLFVACERSPKAGYHQVFGYTRKQGLAEKRTAAREEVYQEDRRAELRSMYSNLLALAERHRPKDERLKEGLRQLLSELGPGPRTPSQGPARQQEQRAEPARRHEHRPHHLHELFEVARQVGGVEKAKGQVKESLAEASREKEGREGPTPPAGRATKEAGPPEQRNGHMPPAGDAKEAGGPSPRAARIRDNPHWVVGVSHAAKPPKRDQPLWFATGTGRVQDRVMTPVQGEGKAPGPGEPVRYVIGKVVGEGLVIAHGSTTDLNRAVQAVGKLQRQAERTSGAELAEQALRQQLRRRDGPSMGL